MRAQFNLGGFNINISKSGVRVGAKVGGSYVSTKVVDTKRVGKTEKKK